MNSSEQEITTVPGKLFYKLVGFSFSSSLILTSFITKSLVCWLPKQLFLNPSRKKCFKAFFNKQIPFFFFSSLQNQLSSLANKRVFSLGFFLKSHIFSTSFENCKQHFTCSLPCLTHTKKRQPFHSFARQQFIVKSKGIS